jgi:tetratricopeptide (TPR) repeat protein
MDLPLESRCKLVTDIYKISRDVMITWFDSARSGDLKTMKRIYKNVTTAATTAAAASHHHQQDSHPLIHATGEGTSYGFVGSTVLHWAAANGDIPMMKQLFEWGASPNAQNKGGSTPLHSACSNLRVESASLLLQKGANPDLSDCCNDTASDILRNFSSNGEDRNNNNKKKSGSSTSTNSITKQILGMLQTQSLAMKMSMVSKNNNNNKKSWDISSMKKLVVGCGFFNREDECPKERSELEKVCEMALGHFSLQLDLASNSDSAFEKLKAEFEEKVQKRMLATEKKIKEKSESSANNNNDEDDDDETVELEILNQKAKQTSDKGNQAFSKGDFKLAVQFYTAAISLAPHDATFYSNRAAAYLKMKVPKRALSDAKTAASLRPEWAKPYHRWGCAALDLGLLSDAVAAFKLGLERAPGDASLVSGLEAVMKTLEEKRGSGGGGGGEGKEETSESDVDQDDYYSSAESEDEKIPNVATRQAEAVATSQNFIPIHERKPWFECKVCENRTRDSANTKCCNQQICGTCLKKNNLRCPFKCGK